MQYQLFIVSAIAGLASAYFQPNNANPPTGNPISAPLSFVPGGKPFTITWTPTTQGQVSIILLKGPSENVQYFKTITDATPNTGSFVWNVDPSIPPMDTHYGIEIIAPDGTYQYSPQIGIGAAEGSSSSSGSGSSMTGSVTSYGAVETAPPSSGAEGTAECGALAECPKTTTVSCSSSSSPSAAPAMPTAAGTGSSNNISSPILTPTVPPTVPASLVTVAQPNSPQTSVSIAVVATNGGSGAASSAAGSGNAPQSSGISSALASSSAPLTGVAALVAGLVGLLAL